MAKADYVEQGFRKGYQEALADIADKLMADGARGAWQWIADNTADAGEREIARIYVEELS